jgi:ribonucleoside-diphosphate reductase alpha subunit
MSDTTMYVEKRDGAREPVSFDKVLARIRKAGRGLSVDVTRLAQLVIAEIHDGVKTSELDELAARLAISYMTQNPDWGTLAAQIIVSNCQKNAPATFTSAMEELAALTDSQGRPSPALHEEVIAFIRANADALNAIVRPANDFLLDYFGFKTLEKAYLMKGRNRRIVETPQYMWLRVSVGIHYRWPDALTRIEETYALMSAKAFTHATPTLFNAGTPRPQLSSCFLVAMKDDSIEGIFDTIKECAQISKYAGGIGLHVHNIRAQGTSIAGTQGTSNGLVPMLRVFNNTARYVDQCFLPGTLVYTENGPRNIEDIGVGDKVLTSTGSYETVNRPLRHDYSGPVMRITIKNGMDPILVTPEHNVLALTDQAKMLNHSVITNRLEKGLKEVDWVDVKDLHEGDFLAFKIPTYEKDIPSISEADCRLYGIMLGDGYISDSVSGVTMNTNTKAEGIAFVKEYFGSRGIKLYIDEQPNVTRVRWSTTSTDFKFTHSQLYNGADEKCMTPAFLHLPKNKILQVLRGIIETDGCVGTKEISLEMTSKSLLEQVRYLILRLGGLTSGYSRNRIGQVSPYKNITTRLPSWCIRIPRLPEIMEMFPSAPKSDYFTFFRYEDMLLSRIDSIEEDVYEGVVHDFEVDTTHDYTVAHMGIAHNGGGRRNGSFAIYLEPWHADIQSFLKLKSNTGSEEERARDLFYAMWVPDLFMKRVEAGGDWSLFCPHEAPGLADAYGPEFEALYTRYEAEGRARRTVPAQKLWSEILVSQIETGTPYLVYKDAANAKSNQKNLGTIKSSNLCSEIIEYSSPDETAVCNLASIALPYFLETDPSGNRHFNFDKLRAVVSVIVRNLNRVIDINYYPTPETKRSNMRHRPIGIGVQGLADVFAMMGMAWETPEAARLNQEIFENIYYAAVEESHIQALQDGPYETFRGSPASQGLLQPDLWSADSFDGGKRVGPLCYSQHYLDWTSLRTKVARDGLRNSLLLAPMPTASTSQILGYNECIEPFTTNIYTRRTLAGEFIVVNRHLVADLIATGLWTPELKERIIAANGSIQQIPEIPVHLKERYKTVWEIKQKTLIDMAADRGAYVCQSQSLNLFVQDPTIAKLSSMHFYAWRRGLKTGIYYLRTKSAVQAIKFTVDPSLIKAHTQAAPAGDKECLLCSS